MKKILLSLAGLLALTFFASTANASKTSSCVKKTACGKAISLACVKAAAARYGTCRKNVSVNYGKCTVLYRFCSSRCRRIKSPKLRALCYSGCKRRYGSTIARCAALSRTGYAICGKVYNAAKARCYRTKYRYCKASKATPRTSCLQAYGARYSACLKSASISYGRCRAGYSGCTYRCRNLRASTIVKKACYRNCATKYAKTLSACSARYNAARTSCSTTYSAGKARCMKLPVVACSRWVCGPCR